jgi:PAS domain-containing protein
MGDEARQALDEKHCLKMLEHLPVAVLIAEVSGRPLYMNRSARNLLGMGLQDLDPEAGIGDLLKVFCAHVAGTNQLYPRERSPLAKALTGEISTVDDMEIRHQGQTIPLEVSASPIFDEKGEVAFAIAVFKDIADRKKEERDLSQRRNELERLIARPGPVVDGFRFFHGNGSRCRRRSGAGSPASSMMRSARP